VIGLVLTREIVPCPVAFPGRHHQYGAVVAYFGLLRIVGVFQLSPLLLLTHRSHWPGLSPAQGGILDLMNQETNHLDQNTSGLIREMRVKSNSATFRSLTPSAKLCYTTFHSMSNPDKTVAIVGQTGAGKTYLVKSDQPYLRCNPGPGLC